MFISQGKALTISSATPVPPVSLGLVAKGGMAMIMGQIIGTIFQYGANLGLAWRFGAAATGLFASGLSILQIVALLGQMGAQQTLLRFVPIYRGTQDAALLRGVLLSGFALGLVGTLLPAILLYTDSTAFAVWIGRIEIAPVVRRLAPAVPLMALITLESFALQGAKRPGLVAALRGVSLQAAIAIALIVVWQLNKPFETFLTLYTFALLVTATLGTLLTWREFTEWRPWRKLDFSVREWLLFSMLAVVTEFFQTAQGWLDVPILTRFCDMKQVGIYYAALRTSLLVTISLSAFGVMLAPMAADLSHRKDMAGFGQLYRTTTRWISTLTLPILVTMSVAHRELMAVFGQEFTSGGTVLIILLLGQMVHGITGGPGYLLVMTGHQRIAFLNSVINLVAIVGGMWWIVPRHGIIGGALVSALTLAGMNILKLLQVRRLMGAQPYDIVFMRHLVAGVAATLAALLVHKGVSDTFGYYASLAFIAGTVFAVYSALLQLLGLPSEERTILKQIELRLRVWCRKQ